MRRFLVPVVAMAALVAGACGGGGDDPGQIVRAAATKTAAAESSRVAMTVETAGGGQTGTVSVNGAFDYGTKRGALTMDLSNVPGAGGLGKLDAVADGTVIYVKFPTELAAQVPGAKPWVRVDLQTIGEQAGFDFGQLGELQQGDPTQALQYLRGASNDVTKVGEETVRGAETTHYRATLDLTKAGEQLSGDLKKAYDSAIATLGTATMPADVWIDGEGRARKLRFAPDLSKASSGEVGETTITVELFDFGVDVDAQPPPADQVVDLGALLGGGRGAAG